MTDNGAAYTSHPLAQATAPTGSVAPWARPDTPRINGKAEHFIQTLLREWAYACVYPSSQHRVAELSYSVQHDNLHCIRRVIHGGQPQPPASDSPETVW